MKFNKIIKEVNKLVSMGLSNGFGFICNDMIHVCVKWKDGLPLTNDGMMEYRF